MFSKTKSLLVVTAVVEVGAGILLLVNPSRAAELLLGAGLPSPESILVGRIGGAALLSISFTCWLERTRAAVTPALGVVVGVLVYNAAVALLLAYAALVVKLTGVGIWPACGLHFVLALWCVAVLRAAGNVSRQRHSGTPS